MAPDDVAIIIAKLAKVEQELTDYKESHEKMALERQKVNFEKLNQIEKKVDGFIASCVGTKNKARIDTLYIWLTIASFFVVLLLAIHGISVDILKFIPKG